MSLTQTQVTPTLIDTTGAAPGNVLTYNSLTNTWVASALPSSADVNEVTPIGSIHYFAAAVAPIGYLECNGAVLSRSQYPELDTAIYCGDAKNASASFGYRCFNPSYPSTTRTVSGPYIVLPDLRGEFVRGWDNGSSVDNGRLFGSNQADDFKSHTHKSPTQGPGLENNTADGYEVPTRNTAYADYDYGRAALTESTGGTETRPRNIALLACIKVAKTASVFSLANYIPRPSIPPTDGQVLTYDAPSSSWKAKDATGGSGGDSVPIGSVSWFGVSTPPTGYLECNGAIINIADYNDLWLAITNTFNTGGESPLQFRLPDLRGEFVRGWDHGKGVDAGRTFGSLQSHEIQSHSHNIIGGGGGSGGPFIDMYNTGAGTPQTFTTALNGGTETRPRNVALMPCIKARKTATVATLENYIEKPLSPSGGKILIFDGTTSKWIAGTAYTPLANSNGYGIRTVSTNSPTGGTDGDIWYQY